MCIGGGSSSVSIGPRDTSGEPIKSAYDLPSELQAQQPTKAKPKNKAKSLIGGGGDREANTGGVTFSGSQPTGRPIGSRGLSGFRDAGGGFLT